MDAVCKVINLSIRPFVSKETAARVAERIFGLQVLKMKELDSYDDRNLYVEGILNQNFNENIEHGKNSPNRSQFVFKIMHSKDTDALDLLDATEAAIQHINAILGEHVSFPVQVRALNGEFNTLVDIEIPEDELKRQGIDDVEKIKEYNRFSNSAGHLKCCVNEDGRSIVTFKHYVRLLSYVPGDMFPLENIDNDLFFQAGQLAGRVVNAFKDFSRPALVAKQNIWDLKSLLWLRIPKYLDAVKDPKKRNMLETGLKMFEENVVSVLSELPAQTIHSDLNECNLLTHKRNGKEIITGLIDFGDMTFSCRVFEVAICMLYLCLLRKEECVKVSGIVLAGYLSKAWLTQKEFDVLYFCVVGRVVQSLVIGNYQYSIADTGNTYLTNTSKTGWNVLETLLKYQDCRSKILESWLECCSDEAKKFYKI